MVAKQGERLGGVCKLVARKKAWDTCIQTQNREHKAPASYFTHLAVEAGGSEVFWNIREHHNNHRKILKSGRRFQNLIQKPKVVSLPSGKSKWPLIVHTPNKHNAWFHLSRIQL